MHGAFLGAPDPSNLCKNLQHCLPFGVNWVPYSLYFKVSAVAALQKPSQRMLPDVVKLIRLLLTLPVSSVAAERSFSALRRLKTWLRSTIGQERLNAVAICHVHRERIARVDLDCVAAAFVRLNSHRQKVFGSSSVKPSSAARPLLSAPLAQLVERWTPGGESPGSRRCGARYLRYS